MPITSFGRFTGSFLMQEEYRIEKKDKKRAKRRIRFILLNLDEFTNVQILERTGSYIFINFAPAKLRIFAFRLTYLIFYK